MHDRSRIMSKIVKAKVHGSREANCHGKPIRDLGRCSFDNSAVNSLNLINYKIWIFNLTITRVSLWLLDYPLSVWSLDHILTYGNNVPFNVRGLKRADFSAAHRAKGSQKDGDFKFLSFNVFEKLLDIGIIRTVQIGLDRSRKRYLQAKIRSKHIQTCREQCVNISHAFWRFSGC